METWDEQTWDAEQRRRVARYFDLLYEIDKRLRTERDEPASDGNDAAVGKAGSPHPGREG